MGINPIKKFKEETKMKKFIDVETICKAAAAGLTFAGTLKIVDALSGVPKKIKEAHAVRKEARAEKKEKK